MQTRNEDALIHAAQKGDLHAFNQLVLQFQGLVYNVAYRILGDGELAADVAQESFIKAYNGISGFRGGSFKAWLTRIATNACYDALRHKQRRPADSIDDMAVEPEYMPHLQSDEESPDSYVVRSELSDLIQACINELPDDQRITLVLADIQGMSYQEIADITGVSLGTVKSRLSRARARLRDFLLVHEELLPRAYRLSDK